MWDFLVDCATFINHLNTFGALILGGFVSVGALGLVAFVTLTAQE